MFIQNWNAKMSQSMQIIESKDDLIKPFEDGEKNHKDFKIGTEHEKFAFFIKNNNQYLLRVKMELSPYFCL